MNQYRYQDGEDYDVLEKAIIENGQIAGWEQDVRIPVHRNSVQNDVNELKEWKEEQESPVPDGVVRGIKEIENFLSGVMDSESLTVLIDNLTASLTMAINSRYAKPTGGIPSSDMTADVQQSLRKANTALQSFTETDPTVPAWAKAATKPSYTAQEVGAMPANTPIPDISGKADKDNVYEKPDMAKLAVILSLSSLTATGTITSVTNPEWKYVITDNEDRILFGIKQNNEWCIFEGLDNILDCVISSYATA